MMISGYSMSMTVLSLAVLLIFGGVVWSAWRHYRRHHDDRAARELLIAVGLFVASIGLLMSASASFFDIGVEGRSEMRNIGLGIVRGAMLVTAITFYLAHRKEP
jgi:cbb3-type cytochrome oxidase subunit 3